MTRRPALRWGISLGLAMCVWMYAEHLAGFYTTDLERGQYADMAIVILPIVALFLAIRERRAAAADGRLTIGEGMVTGMATILISFPISMVFLLFYHHQVNPQWIDHLVTWEQTRMQAAGASAADVAAMAAARRRGASPGREIVQGLIGTIVLGLVLSLVSSLLLRRTGRRTPAARLDR